MSCDVLKYNTCRYLTCIIFCLASLGIHLKYVFNSLSFVSLNKISVNLKHAATSSTMNGSRKAGCSYFCNFQRKKANVYFNFSWMAAAAADMINVLLILQEATSPLYNTTNYNQYYYYVSLFLFLFFPVPSSFAISLSLQPVSLDPESHWLHGHARPEADARQTGSQVPTETEGTPDV